MANDRSGFKITSLLSALAIPLLVGWFSSFLTSDAMKQYQSFSKPLLSPPGWLFPVVWTILYLMMGLASYYVVTSATEKEERWKALAFYGGQLALNFFWSILFFHYQSYLLAFFWLIALWVTVLLTAIRFYRIHKLSGFLLIPYILWLTFAGYLNFAVYQLSQTPAPV